MTRREQREQILQKHANAQEINAFALPVILDALDALDSPPVLDRKALQEQHTQYRMGKIDETTFLDWLITEWAHGVTVTQEQVSQVLKAYFRFASEAHINTVTKDLMALRHPPEPKLKVWCPHIQFHVGNNRFVMIRSDESFIIMQEDWDQCPVRGCRKARPA